MFLSNSVVEYILGDSSPLAQAHSTAFMRNRKTLTDRGIITISAIQSNAAAGGLALATCCDIVLCSANAVLNPHYRSVGLFGSEFHRYHWIQRAGLEVADEMMRKMLPIDPEQAKDMGLVDKVIGTRMSSPEEIEMGIKAHVSQLGRARVGEQSRFKTFPWKSNASSGSQEVSPVTPLIDHLVQLKKAHHAQLEFPLVHYRNEELSQMLLDFYHPDRSPRYHDRRRAFVGKHLPKATPLRFAEHNREGEEDLDIEERDVFDDAPGWTRGEEWRWAGEMVPEGFLNARPFDPKLLVKHDNVPQVDLGHPIQSDYGQEKIHKVKIATSGDFPVRESQSQSSPSESDHGKSSTDSSRSQLHEKTVNSNQLTRQTRGQGILNAPRTIPTGQGEAKRSSVDFKATFRKAISMAARMKTSTGPGQLEKKPMVTSQAVNQPRLSIGGNDKVSGKEREGEAPPILFPCYYSVPEDQQQQQRREV